MNVGHQAELMGFCQTRKKQHRGEKHDLDIQKEVRTRKTQWEEEDEMIRRALREAAQIATIVFSIVAIIFSIIALMQ